MTGGRRNRFYIAIASVLILSFLATVFVDNQYYFFAGFAILQLIVMALAWNILGGYVGYVNFGSAAFFGLGAYAAIVSIQLFDASLFTQIVIGGLFAALLGFVTGYLTLRLRGVYFAIATLALLVVAETLIANFDYVGGAAGTYILPTRKPTILGVLIVGKEDALFDNYKEMLFFIMSFITLAAITTCSFIEKSRFGRGLAALRDNEEAAECMGVPTLRLKLIATSLSGLFMGFTGAIFPYYLTFVDPTSAFNLDISVNALAMPIIGGTATWLGPVLGAIVLGTMQQVATVTISSELNLLIVGIFLVAIVIFAPQGFLGLIEKFRRRGD
jgi:branched-chain amino acid transport system permease protein